MNYLTRFHKKEQVSFLTLAMGVMLSLTVLASASSIPIANTLKTWLDYLVGLSYYVVGIAIVFTAYSYFSSKFNWLIGLAVIIIGSLIANLYTILDKLGMSVGCIC